MAHLVRDDRRAHQPCPEEAAVEADDGRRARRGRRRGPPPRHSGSFPSHSGSRGYRRCGGRCFRGGLGSGEPDGRTLLEDGREILLGGVASAAHEQHGLARGLGSIEQPLENQSLLLVLLLVLLVLVLVLGRLATAATLAAGATFAALDGRRGFGGDGAGDDSVVEADRPDCNAERQLPQLGKLEEDGVVGRIAHRCRMARVQTEGRSAQLLPVLLPAAIVEPVARGCRDLPIEGRGSARSGSEDIGSQGKPSEASGSHRKPSEAFRHRNTPEATRSHQKPPEVRPHQKPSGAIRSHQEPSESHQRPSGSIRIPPTCPRS